MSESISFFALCRQNDVYIDESTGDVDVPAVSVKRQRTADDTGIAASSLDTTQVLADDLPNTVSVSGSVTSLGTATLASQSLQTASDNSECDLLDLLQFDDGPRERDSNEADDFLFGDVSDPLNGS